MTLLNRLEHPPNKSKKPRLYPMNRTDALLQFLVGGVAPKPLNSGEARSLAAKEKSGR
jgi:hypothetical protein